MAAPICVAGPEEDHSVLHIHRANVQTASSTRSARSFPHRYTIRCRTRSSQCRVDGVCANVEFPVPARLVNGAVNAAAGADQRE
jgi:hypothetical protein